MRSTPTLSHQRQTSNTTADPSARHRAANTPAALEALVNVQGEQKKKKGYIAPWQDQTMIRPAKRSAQARQKGPGRRHQRWKPAWGETRAVRLPGTTARRRNAGMPETGVCYNGWIKNRCCRPWYTLASNTLLPSAD